MNVKIIYTDEPATSLGLTLRHMAWQIQIRFPTCGVQIETEVAEDKAEPSGQEDGGVLPGIVRSSLGTFVFHRATGVVLETNLSEEFGPMPIQVDLGTLGPDFYKYGEVDVLHIGFFYLDEFNRRTYEAPLKHSDMTCPVCGSAFNASCLCFPKICKSPRGTLYVERKEFDKYTAATVLQS